MKKFLSILLSALMLTTMSMVAMATENSKSDDIPYSFPITPGSSEWESFTTKQEMLDVCQIPEDKLACMTTEALLETVMNYPLICDYIAFNSYEDACNVMSKDFNGFNELFSRKDVTPIILSKYSSVHVITANEVDNADSASFFAPAIIEYLLVCDEIKNGEITGNEADLLSEIHAEKSSNRSVAGIYSIQSEVYSAYKEAEAVTRAGETWKAVSSGTVKTPKKSIVPEVYKRSPEMTTAEKTRLIAMKKNDIRVLQELRNQL